MKLLYGPYQPDGGRILFDGKEIGSMEGRSAAVFQDYKLFAYTLYGNVVLGRKEDAELMPLFEQLGLKGTVENYQGSL